MTDIITDILKLNLRRDMRNVTRRGLKLMEEAGELARAVLTLTHPRNPRGLFHQDLREEAVDAAIMGIDVALTPGWGETPEQAEAETRRLFEEKLTKWRTQMSAGSDITLEWVQ